MPERNPFQEEKQCPKCGCNEVTTVWHEGGHACTCAHCPGEQTQGEHLLRRCPRCTFGWLEAPLDAGPELINITLRGDHVAHLPSVRKVPEEPEPADESTTGGQPDEGI